MSEPTTQRLKVSREGIVLIKSFEGFRPRAVRGEDGRWVIGYGHTASAREGLTVGESDAELLLQYDLLPVVKALNERVAAPLNQHQFDALASFAVSVGVDRFLSSDVLRELNAGHAGEAADALIGWPETAAPDDRLRRRAAERALFVADPGHAVALAELLSAPLPPPPVEAAPPPRPEPAPEPEPAPAADARAAAVASLLGETPETAAPAPVVPLSAPEPRAPQADPFAHAPSVFAPAQPNVTVSLQRFSPYSAAVIGPLPGFPPASPAPAAVEAEAPAAIEPGPSSAEAADVAAPKHSEPEAVAPEPVVEPSPEPAPASVEPPPFRTAPAASPFPPMDEPLVLTPPTETDFLDAARPAWTPEQRLGPGASEETVLFEEEPVLSVLRHEIEPAQPRRFDWNESGAFLIMGGVGLASCAFSAAAFRLSVDQPSPMGETTVIAWALALIGVICVGVASWNLYVKWGRND